MNQYYTCNEKFDNQTPSLLKEITNICSKKNMTIVEIQKKALDKKNIHNKMNLQKYIEKKEKEDSQVKKVQ